MDSPSQPVVFGRAATASAEARPRFLKALKRVMSWMIGISILSGLVMYLRASPLIDPVPPLWSVGIFAFGMTFGACFFALADQLSDDPKHKIGLYLVGGLIVGACFTFNALSMFEAYAFTGVSPGLSQIYAPITSDSECRGFKNMRGFRLGVNPYWGDRRLDVSVTDSVCRIFRGPELPDGKYCLLLDVETGRNSIRRVAAPVFTPIGSDRLRKCPTQ